MKIIGTANQKGGVGKTTTALAIYHGLRAMGKNVLAIDLDPQGNFTKRFKNGLDTTRTGAYALFEQKKSVMDEVQVVDGCAIIPYSPLLNNVEMLLINAIRREYRMAKALKELEIYYDYVVIDTPPALGVLTINAFTACDGLVIPIEADVFSLEGVEQLRDTLEAVKEYSNPDLKLYGILTTRYRKTVLGRTIIEKFVSISGVLETRLFNSIIRESVAIKVAHAKGQSIFDYAPKSNAAIDYMAFIKELYNRSLKE